MSDSEDLEQWVLICSSVIKRAFRELYRDGECELFEFPPSEPTKPAATVLGTVFSNKLSTVKCIVDARELRVVIAELFEEAADQAERDAIAAFEASVLKHLEDHIYWEPGAPVAIGEAIRHWGPDVVVTCDPRTERACQAMDVLVMSVVGWIRTCISLGRTCHPK